LGRGSLDFARSTVGLLENPPLPQLQPHTLSICRGTHIENWHRTGEARRCILHGMRVVDSSRQAVEMMKIDETGLKKPSTILCPYLSSKMGARIGQ